MLVYGLCPNRDQAHSLTPHLSKMHCSQSHCHVHTGFAVDAFAVFVRRGIDFRGCYLLTYSASSKTGKLSLLKPILRFSKITELDAVG